MFGVYSITPRSLGACQGLGGVWPCWRCYCIFPIISQLLEHLFSITIQLFTEDFPHANIYKLISANILYQVIKGAFKDHLVIWIQEWIEADKGKKEVK